MNYEVPRTLPVEHLSHSSLNLYYRCPEKWRRRYLDLEYEPTNPALLTGKSVGGAVSAGYITKLAGEPFGEAMLQTASDIVDEVAGSEEVDWQDSSAGQVKDVAIKCVGTYHDKVAVQFEPVTVEEGFEVQFPETDWNVTGFIDITGEAPGLSAELHDVKTVSKANNGIDTDVQVTLYVASRYVRDGTLPPFAWHEIKKPTVRNAPEVRLMTTTRTAEQIDNYLARIAAVAREIAWRTETGNWAGAPPGAWWCSDRMCGYYSTCPLGGAQVRREDGD